MIKSELHGAANSILLEQHDSHINNAIRSLRFLKHLVTMSLDTPDLDVDTQHVLSEIVEVSYYWRNFRTNELDVAMRAEEAKMLLWLLPKTTGGLVALYGKLLDKERGPKFEGEENFSKTNSEFFDLLEESAVPEAYSYFFDNAMHEKIKEPGGEYQGATQLLLSPQSALLKKANLEKLSQLLATKDNTQVQLAMNKSFDMLCERLFTGAISVTAQQVQETVGNEEYIGPLWELYICAPLNYRAHRDVIKMHRQISEHVEYELRIPDWIDKKLVDEQ